MLFVSTLAILVTVAATYKQTLRSTDQGQRCDSLFPHVLALERKVAVLSIKQEDIESVKSDLKKVKSQLRKNISDLAGLKQTISKMHSDVAFEANLPSHLTNVDDYDVLRFTSVIHNRGQGYNKHTGIFTVPVSGTYMLWTHILLLDSNYLLIFIYKDGSQIGESFLPGGRIDTASVTTAWYLKKGDQIWVTKKGSSKLNGNGFSYFGGVLLHAH